MASILWSNRHTLVKSTQRLRQVYPGQIDQPRCKKGRIDWWLRHYEPPPPPSSQFKTTSCLLVSRTAHPVLQFSICALLLKNTRPVRALLKVSIGQVRFLWRGRSWRTEQWSSQLEEGVKLTSRRRTAGKCAAFWWRRRSTTKGKFFKEICIFYESLLMLMKVNSTVHNIQRTKLRGKMNCTFCVDACVERTMW